MKTRWEYLEFEDCIDKIVYTNKIKRKDFLVKGEYKIISQEENYINGYWNAESDLFKIIKPVVIFGDHTKNLKYIDFDFVLGADGVKIFQPIDCINTKYFYYFLKSVKLKDLGYARHYRLLKEIKVPLPPIPEQKRIVKILDEAFAAIDKAKANAEKNLQNSRELFDSYLNKVFANPGEDWEEKKLGEVCLLKSGTTISKRIEKSAGEILYAKVADMNLKGNEISINNSARFANLCDIKKNQIIPIGAVIFPKRGGAIFTNKKRKIVKPTIVDLNTMAIIPTPKINENFLYYWFSKIDLSKLNTGSSIPQINNYSFDDVKISFPKSVTSQKKIVAVLDRLFTETQKLKSIYQQKLADLEELKKSILQKAFEGQLTRNNG